MVNFAEVATDVAIPPFKIEAASLACKRSVFACLALLRFYQPSVSFDTHVLNKSPRSFVSSRLEQIDVGQFRGRAVELCPNLSHKWIAAAH